MIRDEFGFNSNNNLDSSTSRRDPKLATQQKLGLWTKRRDRPSAGDHHYPVTAEGHLDESLYIARRRKG